MSNYTLDELGIIGDYINETSSLFFGSDSEAWENFVLEMALIVRLKRMRERTEQTLAMRNPKAEAMTDG